MYGRDNEMDGTISNYAVFSNKDMGKYANTCLQEKANIEMYLECCKVTKECDDCGHFWGEEDM